VLPAALLAFLAIRAINREEAFLERQYERTFTAELVHAVDLLTDELGQVQQELDRTAPAAAGDNPDASFGRWKQETSLVRTPFLLSPRYEILWPRISATASQDELSFINGNREFVTNRAEIPVYSNIAVVYQTEIAGLAQSASGGRVEAAPKPGQAETRREEARSASPWSPARMSEQKSGDKMFGAPPAASSEQKGRQEKEKSSAAPQSQPIEPDTLKSQQALKDFEESDAIRQQVYQQARERGQQPVSRNVMPSAGEARPKTTEPAESIFISEPKKFSQIIAGRESGLIPRFLGEDLNLFYWKKESGGRIMGCVIDEAALRVRFLGRLPAVLSASRLLTVLDEAGRPLATPQGDKPRDWRRPFVSREVSELLPRWEAAVYLIDPGLIHARASLTAVILWTLVLTFLVSILTGGTLVLKTLRSEMEMARKKTTFVTNVSHELKTPLTSIRMFAEMLKEGRQPDPGRRDQYLDLMVSETDRLTKLINNVLDFSRLEKGQKQYTLKLLEANRLAQDLFQGQRLRLEHNGFKIELRPAAESVFIRADEEAVKQALLNLLSNAEKYSAARREVEVEVAGQGGQVFFRVKDRGVGIPPSQAKKIFQEFYRVDESLTARAKGTGLGLSIARRIVRDQGGDITYAPREGGGSVFELRLPRSEPA
jgi:signal transduction histidine kinase